MSQGSRDKRSAALPWPALLAAWLVSFAVYAGYFQGQWTYGERPIFHITGDEPHYLTIATSLLKDRDLDVHNNYRDKDYFPYYPYHLGDPRDPEDMHAIYGRGGGLYSKHGIGLSLAVLPAMWLGGHGWATVLMMGFAAVLSVSVLLLAWESAGRAWPAVLAWLGVAFSPPLLLYAPLFYPELLGALLTLVGIRAALRSWTAVPGAGTLLVAGSAAGLLPWLHLRYIPLAAAIGFAAFVALATRRAWRHVPLLVVPAALAGGALLYLDWRLFGGIPAVDEYGTVSVGHLLVGAPGLLFDRQFGLLPYAPLYVVALAGLAIVPRSFGRARSFVLLAPLGIYVLFIACFSYWYGAFSPPARMLVPVLPLLVCPLALALTRWPGLRALYLALLALTVGISHLLMDVPRLRYSLPTGGSEMLEYLSRVWGRDVTGWLPTFIVPTAASYAWAAAATLLAAAVCLALVWLSGARSMRLPRLPAAPQPARPSLRRAE